MDREEDAAISLPVHIVFESTNDPDTAPSKPINS